MSASHSKVTHLLPVCINETSVVKRPLPLQSSLALQKQIVPAGSLAGKDNFSLFEHSSVCISSLKLIFGRVDVDILTRTSSRVSRKEAHAGVSHAAGLFKKWRRGTCKLTESSSKEEARSGVESGPKLQRSKVGNSEVGNFKAVIRRSGGRHRHKVAKVMRYESRARAFVSLSTRNRLPAPGGCRGMKREREREKKGLL